MKATETKVSASLFAARSYDSSSPQRTSPHLGVGTRIAFGDREHDRDDGDDDHEHVESQRDDGGPAHRQDGGPAPGPRDSGRDSLLEGVLSLS